MKYPINPQTEDVGIPLNLLYLSHYLKGKTSIEVDIFDERLNKITKKDKIEDKIASYDAIGITVSSSDISRAVEIARLAKRMNPSVTVILGGILTFSNEEYLLRNYPEIDYVISGEGEMALLNLVTALRGNSSMDIKGVSRRRGAELLVSKTQNMLAENKIPRLDYSDAEILPYRPFDNGSIYGSRGCKGRCKFCTISKFWKHEHRERNNADIIDEILFYHKLGFDLVSFKDENFLFNRIWAESLLKDIIKLDIGARFKIKSRIDLIVADIIPLLKRAGVVEIQTGIEDITPEIIRRTGKYPAGHAAINPEKTLETLNNNGIALNCIFMFGLDGATHRTVGDNVDYIKKLHANYSGLKPYFTFLAPQPFRGEFHTQGKYVLLNNDLDYFTHLFPVAVPKTLGHWEAGLGALIDGYNEIVNFTKTQHLNPLITPNYTSTLHPTENKLKIY